jgi:tape measure domain-containing protein
VIAGQLEWQSNIARGARADAAAVLALKAALQGLAATGGVGATGSGIGQQRDGIGRFVAGASSGATQLEVIAATSAAKQQAILAASQGAQANIMARGRANIVALMVKRDADVTRQEAKSAADVLRIREKSAADQLRAQARLQEAQLRASRQARGVRPAGAGVSTDVLSALLPGGAGLQSALSSGGVGLAAGPIAAAASALMAAAAAILAAVAALAATGLKMALQASAFRETTIRAAGTFLGSQRAGAEFFAEGFKFAAEAGLDARETIQGMQTLLSNGFKRESITELTKAFADLKAIKPDTNIASIATRLAQIRATGYLQGDELNELANAGVSRDLIFKALSQQTGKTQAELMKMQTARKITAEMVEKALLAAVPNLTQMPLGEFSKANANTLEGLWNRIKAIPGNFFLAMDLNVQPLKDFMRNVLDAFAGPSGKALTRATSDLFSAVVESIFGPFRKKDGSIDVAAVMQTMTVWIVRMTAAVRAAGPSIQALITLIGLLSTEQKGFSDGAKGFATRQLFLGPIDGLLRLIDLIDLAEKRLGGFSLSMLLTGGLSTLGDTDILAAVLKFDIDLVSQGYRLGADFVSGIAAGIAGAVGGAVAAAQSMAQQVVAAARGWAGFNSHSPSRKGFDVGFDFPQGVALGIQSGANDTVWAAREMARDALAASRIGGGMAGVVPIGAGGAPGAGGVVGSGGAPGGGSVIVQVAPGAVVVQIGAGVSSQAGGDAALAQMCADAVRAEFRRLAERGAA